MAQRRLSFGKGVRLIAALLLLTSSVLAGDRVHSPSPPPPEPKPTPAPVVYHTQPVTITIDVEKSAQPMKDSLTVRLRGPDGQVRRYPVEGGWKSIQIARPVVLRPGQTITIRWVAAK
jgi:hypothetical protein